MTATIENKKYIPYRDLEVYAFRMSSLVASRFVLHFRIIACLLAIVIAATSFSCLYPSYALHVSVVLFCMALTALAVLVFMLRYAHINLFKYYLFEQITHISYEDAEQLVDQLRALYANDIKPEQISDIVAQEWRFVKETLVQQ
jgi:hypothetical protein